VWEKLEDGSFVSAFCPHEEAPNGSAKELTTRQMAEDKRARVCVKALVKGFWKFTPIAPNVTRVTLVQRGQMGGKVPEWIFKK
jgi:hypothetical protein